MVGTPFAVRRRARSYVHDDEENMITGPGGRNESGTSKDKSKDERKTGKNNKNVAEPMDGNLPSEIRHSSITSTCSSIGSAIMYPGLSAEQDARKENKNPNMISDNLQMLPVKVEGPPPNLDEVIPGLYRSGFPEANNYGYLKEMKLRTVVSLTNKDIPAEFVLFLKENGIKHIVIEMAGTKKVDIPLHNMTTILQAMKHEQYPLLVHCNGGRHRTGCSIALFRKLHGAELPTIIDEYRKHAMGKPRDVDITYITNFEISTLPLLSQDLEGQGVQLARNTSPRLWRGMPNASSYVWRLWTLLGFIFGCVVIGSMFSTRLDL